jgi:hypothetical protein
MAVGGFLTINMLPSLAVTIPAPNVLWVVTPEVTFIPFMAGLKYQGHSRPHTVGSRLYVYSWRGLGHRHLRLGLSVSRTITAGTVLLTPV